MKKRLAVPLLISLLVVVSNLFVGITLGLFVAAILVLLLLAYSAVAESLGLFTVSSITLFIFIIFFLAESVGILPIITVFAFVAFYIDCVYYIFNLGNNKMNIQFDNLVFDKDKEYLLIIYLSGPIKEYNIKGVVIREKDKYILKVETKSKEVKEVELWFKDIKNVSIKESPYMKPKTSYNNYETDYMKSNSIGKFTGDFQTYKSYKMIPSYEITISLNDDSSVNLVSFDNPSILD